MHVLRSIPVTATILIIGSSAPIMSINGMYQMDMLKKCCVPEYIFNEELECVKVNGTESNANTIADEKSALFPVYAIACLEDASFPLNERLSRAYATLFMPSEVCVEKMTNGSEVMAKCPGRLPVTYVVDNMATTQAGIENKKNVMATISNLGTVVFWGAQTYMMTNIAHVVLCIIVVVIYLSVPELNKGLYNRAVLRHNFSLLFMGSVLTLLGYCDLSDCHIHGNVTIVLWLVLQYFTIATVFWLNVICFDMTLSITRFRWMLGSGKRSDQEENRKLLFYGVFAWGGSLLPTAMATIFEFVPGIPENFPLKPNYLRFDMGPNLAVNMYFFAVPMVTLLCNNVLFIFTTYKIIRIQRSTEIATKNNENVLRKKYFLFLRLYLLMGAPWFFGMLFACLNKLFVLKICRLIQPILWLLMLITHKKFKRKVLDKLGLLKPEEPNERATTSNP